MPKLGERPVKIFATDVHRGSLEQRGARPSTARRRWRTSRPSASRATSLRSGDSYQVVPELRQMVVFAQHNVIKDAPFTRVDLVSCRNLLIYLQPAAQQKVLSLFHFALNRGGVLFLGPSESAGPARARLRDRRQALAALPQAQRRAHAGRHAPPAAAAAEPRRRRSRPPRPAARYSLSQLLGTYDALLDEVMPPSLLVNDRGELVHAFGGASRFLRMRDGRKGSTSSSWSTPSSKMVLVGGSSAR